MGKQINFYMSEHIQEEFIEYLKQNQFKFLNSSADIVNQLSSSSIFSAYLYKPDYGQIVMCQDNKARIDILKSPVIEFSKTIIKAEQKKILRGRLWISDQYYGEEGNLIKKEKVFVKDYQMLRRWIKKYIPYQEIKKGEYLVKEYINDELKELQDGGFALTISL